MREIKESEHLQVVRLTCAMVRRSATLVRGSTWI